MMRAARIALFFFMFGMRAEAPGTTWYVDAAAAPGGDGLSWDKALQTIQAAVDVAVEGDMIIVAPGEYSSDEGLAIRERVTLRSKDPSDPTIVQTTIIHGTTIHPVYMLSGFTVRGGSIVCRSRAKAVTNNVICYGQGIIVSYGSPVISSNLIFGNLAEQGAPIFCLWPSSPIITNNVIVANTSEGNGGGIYCDWETHPLIANNTIVGNHAALHGGGVYAAEGSSPTIMNCIIWDNGDDLFGCSATYSCIQDGDPGEGNIAFFPYFIDPENRDYGLLPWSPCIDAGDPNSEFGEEPQPNGGRINMGAYGNTPQAASIGLGLGFDDLPDDWEMFHFGHVDYGGMDDPDGDRIQNIDEYRFGRNPTVASGARIRNLTAGRSYELIQAAIVAASDGDEVAVAPGQYVKNIDFLGKALTLRSIDPSDPATVASTVLDAGGSGVVVSFARDEGRDSVLLGFTITGGRAKLGAGIFCLGSSPTISGNVITGNSAPDFPETAGCGLYSYGGDPLVKSNTIENNGRCVLGGGICIEAGAASIVDNVVKNNEGSYGGGICIEAGAASIIKNVVRNNEGSYGGGICVRRCTSATIERNLITGNKASGGGGVSVDALWIRLASNLIADNQAYTHGGGVYCARGKAAIVNNTVVNNWAEEGGGVYHGHHGVLTGMPTVRNCILWGNGDDLYPSDRITAVYSCIEDNDPGEGNIHVDPGFLDPENGDYRLRSDSPCINAGNTAAALDMRLLLTEDGALISWSASDDLDGNPRISGNAVDMGAYEYQQGPADLQFLLEHSSDLKFWESIEVGAVWEWTDRLLDDITAGFYRICVP